MSDSTPTEIGESGRVLFTWGHGNCRCVTGIHNGREVLHCEVREYDWTNQPRWAEPCDQSELTTALNYLMEAIRDDTVEKL